MTTEGTPWVQRRCRCRGEKDEPKGESEETREKECLAREVKSSDDKRMGRGGRSVVGRVAMMGCRHEVNEEIGVRVEGSLGPEGTEEAGGRARRRWGENERGCERET